MKLSPTDREVLACISLQGNLDVPEISRQTEIKPHAVRHALKRLMGTGKLRAYPYIDVYTLGYTVNEFYFSLAPDKLSIKSALLDYLVQSPLVGWLAETLGDFQYSSTIFARRLVDLQGFLDGIAARFGRAIASKLIFPRYAFYNVRNTFYLSHRYGPVSLRFGASATQVTIDDLDHNILVMLDRQGSASGRTIARQLSLSPATLAYRIKSLEQRRVIVGYDTVGFVEGAGEALTSVCFQLCIRGVPGDVISQLLSFGAAHRNVISVIQCFGPWDFEVNAVFENGSEVMGFSDELQKRFSDSLQRLTSYSVLRALKISRYPFDLTSPMPGKLGRRQGH